MARLPYPEPGELPEKVREALDRLPSLNIFRMLAHAETAYRPYLRFGGALLSDLQLDPLVRELAILRTAQVIGAEYEWIQHVPIAKAVGLTDAQLIAVELEDDTADAFDARQSVALRFTAAVVREPRPGDELFAELREQLSDREIVELLLVVGSYTMLGRLMTALDLDLDGPLGTDVVDSAASRRGGGGEPAG
jgi:4-carboxymuconolactone decarboxylase